MSQSFFKMCIKNAIQDLDELKVNSFEFNTFLQELKELYNSGDLVLPSKFNVIWEQYKNYLKQYSDVNWIE
jgi:hypothetical protein